VIFLWHRFPYLNLTPGDYRRLYKKPGRKNITIKKEHESMLFPLKYAPEFSRYCTCCIIPLCFMKMNSTSYFILQQHIQLCRAMFFFLKRHKLQPVQARLKPVCGRFS